METKEIWIFIAIAAVSFVVLTKLSNKYWQNGRFGAMLAEGALLFVALFISATSGDGGTIFKIALFLLPVLFAVIFTLIGKKQGEDIVSAVIMGIIQSALSLIGGVVILLASGKRADVKKTSTSKSDFNANDYVEAPKDNGEAQRIERAEARASKDGFGSADEAEDAGINTGKYSRE